MVALKSLWSFGGNRQLVIDKTKLLQTIKLILFFAYSHLMDSGPEQEGEGWFEARKFTDGRNDVTADVRWVCGVRIAPVIAELRHSWWCISRIRNKKSSLAVALQLSARLRPIAFVGTSHKLFLMFLRKRFGCNTLEYVDVVAND